MLPDPSEPYLARIRQRLFSAIQAGELSREDLLENTGDVLARILDCDSTDLVEMNMELEEKGISLKSVGELMKYLDGIDPEDISFFGESR
jgi:hypothetical protein